MADTGAKEKRIPSIELAELLFDRDAQTPVEYGVILRETHSHIDRHGLRDAADRRYIEADKGSDRFQAVFGSKRFNQMDIPRKVRLHSKPAGEANTDESGRWANYFLGKTNEQPSKSIPSSLWMKWKEEEKRGNESPTGTRWNSFWAVANRYS